MAKLLLFKHICKNRCTFVSDLLQIGFYLRFYYENMYQPLRLLLTALLVAVMLSCAEKKKEPLVTPWGEVQTDTILPNDNFTVSDIVGNGELIALTLTGPETYYDYRGRGMGAQYLLCEKFAQKLGVSLRVEVCKDTAEMVKRLLAGDADLIAFPLPKKLAQKNRLIACGAVLTLSVFSGR